MAMHSHGAQQSDLEKSQRSQLGLVAHVPILSILEAEAG